MARVAARRGRDGGGDGQRLADPRAVDDVHRGRVRVLWRARRASGRRCRCRPGALFVVAADRRRLRDRADARRSRSSTSRASTRSPATRRCRRCSSRRCSGRGSTKWGALAVDAVDGRGGARRSRCCSRSFRRRRPARRVTCLSVGGIDVVTRDRRRARPCSGLLPVVPMTIDFGAADVRRVVADAAASRPAPGNLDRDTTYRRHATALTTPPRADAAAVGDLHHRRDRLRVRLVRAADAAADRAAGAGRAAARAGDRPGRSTAGSASSSTCRRWPAASSVCSAAT